MLGSHSYRWSFPTNGPYIVHQPVRTSRTPKGIKLASFIYILHRSILMMLKSELNWEELTQQYVSKSVISNSGHGCCLSFLIFVILLQLEIVIVPLGATFSNKGSGNGGYPWTLAPSQHHNWKRNIDALARNQQKRSSDYRSSSAVTSINILNTTLSGREVMLEKWEHTESISDDQPQQYHSEQFVLFTVTVIHNGRTELFTTESAQIYVIELQPQEELTMICRASLLGLGEDMDVIWWKDNEFIDSANLSVITVDDQNMGLYRCVADVAIVSTDLLDSYLLNNRIKRSTEMPPGKVLSSAFIVKLAIPIHFTVHPKNLTVTGGSVFRLECATSGSSSQPIIWYLNGTEIKVEKGREENVQIYTVGHHSVLHLVGADLNSSGHYQCRSGNVSSDIAIVNITFDEDGNAVRNSAILTELPPELLVPVGESVILECLLDDPQSTPSWDAVNEYGQPIWKYQRDDIKTRTAIVIRSATVRDSGRYTCVTSGKAIRKTFSTFITVQVAPLLLPKRPVRRITGTLGTTIRLRCSGSVEPHDTSFQINWYKDGKKVIPFGRAKVFLL
uniref:Ig-like domain-containing protein n=1 Tax=Setaria digitata TaxID=48799 RepID=A0A915PVP1_9BILA